MSSDEAAAALGFASRGDRRRGPEITATPSCQQKRAELLAEKLREEILAPVPHRHAIFTVPRTLRCLFLRERRLLRDNGAYSNRNRRCDRDEWGREASGKAR